LHTRGLIAFLPEAGLVHHEDTVAVAQLLHHVGTQVVADSVGVPRRGVEQALRAIRRGLTSHLRQRPATRPNNSSKPADQTAKSSSTITRSTA
jgi:hypothetical protein